MNICKCRKSTLGSIAVWMHVRQSQLDILHSIIHDFACVSLRPLHANVRVQTRYFLYWGGSMPCNNIISSMCDSKTILYFIGLCIEYCDMMTTSAGPLHVIVRSVPLGRAGTAREHCSDQGQGGSPGGQVEGPVECTGTCRYEIKNYL